jgi:uncharacterized YccA/Bax inhibitor family protein
MRTSNPALNPDVFDRIESRTGTTMTVQGAVQKTAVLLVLLIVGGAFSWESVRNNPPQGALLAGVGAIGGLIFAFVTCFKQSWAPVTAPIYAVLEGLFLGAISAYLETRFKGIVFQGMTATVGVLASMLVAYQSGMIRVTQKFRMGVVAATGAIFLVYLVGMIMSFFGTSIPYIHQSGWFGIGFSLLVVGVAALNLVLDFDFIEKGAGVGAPKFMEWYAAFGLMVTLVWLYIELIRLLAKLRDR